MTDKKKFVFTTKALYIQHYIISADSLDEAEMLFADTEDSLTEPDVRQMLNEQIMEVKEAQ